MRVQCQPAMSGQSRALAIPRQSEAAIQRAVVDLLGWAARPGVAWTHMPAGELRAASVGGKLKALGVQPGWPDLLIVKDGRLHGLELKAEGGRVSPAQLAAHATLRAAGAEIAVAYGLGEAMAVLKRWEVIR